MRTHFHFHHRLTDAEERMLGPRYWLLLLVTVTLITIATTLVIGGGGL